MIEQRFDHGEAAGGPAAELPRKSSQAHGVGDHQIP
jgi:hypothetical protein